MVKITANDALLPLGPGWKARVGDKISWLPQIRQQKPVKTRQRAKVYPNPARDFATLEYEMDKNKSGEFIVYETIGTVMQRHRIPGGSGKLEFSTQNLKPGIYFYQLHTEEIISGSGKLVIIK